MTHPFSVVPVAGVSDRRNLATFYLNLSRMGGDVVPYRVGRKPAFLINRPDHARYVLSTNQDTYSNPYHPYAELAEYYTPAGAVLFGLNRQISDRPKTSRRIADELVAVATETILRLLEHSGNVLVNVDVEAKKLLFRVITRVLFDVDPHHLGDAFVRAVNFIEECSANQLFLAPSPSPGPLERHYLAAIATQNQTAVWIAHQANIVPVGEQVPAELVLAIARTLLNSYNATAIGLCWIIYQLSQADDVLERLYHEIDQIIGKRRPTVQDLPKLNYTRMVVAETLRLYPPAWIVGRESLTAHWIGSTFIPPGAVISVSSYTIQRNARFWEHPNEFIPERFAAQRTVRHLPYTYFPFGGGKRRCPAGHFVIGHLQLVLAVVLQLCRFEVPSVESIRPRGLISLRPHPGIWARFMSRA